MAWTDMGDAEPADEGELRAVRGRGPLVGLAHFGGTWRAFGDNCSHHECPLSGGWLDGPRVECACHGSIFDLKTGAVLRGPATEPIPIYSVKIWDGRIWVHVYGDVVIQRRRA